MIHIFPSPGIFNYPGQTFNDTSAILTEALIYTIMQMVNGADITGNVVFALATHYLYICFIFYCQYEVPVSTTLISVS